MEGCALINSFIQKHYSEACTTLMCPLTVYLILTSCQLLGSLAILSPLSTVEAAPLIHAFDGRLVFQNEGESCSEDDEVFHDPGDSWERDPHLAGSPLNSPQV